MLMRKASSLVKDMPPDGLSTKKLGKLARYLVPTRMGVGSLSLLLLVFKQLEHTSPHFSSTKDSRTTF